MSRNTTIVTDESDLEDLEDALDRIRELGEVAATHPDYYLRVDDAIKPTLQPHDED